MSDLKFPDKPAGYLIEVRDDGSALRNDGVELTPAAQNPWYVLATVYGEQGKRYHEGLAAKNRRIWNGWACAGKTDEERSELAKQVQLPIEELADLTAEEQSTLKQAFEDRLLDAINIPLPDASIDMSGIHFANTIVLAKCIFNEHAYFRSAAFSGEAVFRSAVFSWDANFHSAAFSRDAVFRPAVFSGYTDFDSAAFSGYAFFDSAAFRRHATFRSAAFSGHADFRSAAFSGEAVFRSAAFSRDADFESAVFGWDAFFNSGAFSGDANFRSAAFSEHADFESAAFRKHATFRSAAFSGDAHFQSAAFSRDADFESAAFRKHAYFSNETFGGTTTFTDTEFHGLVPEFYQRTLHQDTDFTTKDANWPTLTKDNASESKRAYTRLRQMMNELHKPDDEQFFHRQEMRCKALLEDRWNRWPFWIFNTFSGYGHSVMRPIAGLAAVVLFGWFIIGSYLRHGVPDPKNAAIWEGFGVSVSNTFPFLGFHRKWHSEFFDDAHNLIDILSATQSILGIILLFFLGLGLRNRFRIK